MTMDEMHEDGVDIGIQLQTYDICVDMGFTFNVASNNSMRSIKQYVLPVFMHHPYRCHFSLLLYLFL